ncbi:hypothetical protein GCM10009665_10330 [Kitasatospora nipponensis]|uniref:PhoU domain-containing protein n=1 Tax=Kitasatospora nipponensis TaxID=258049 RepID=A0ABP4GE60_9ACTN
MSGNEQEARGRLSDELADLVRLASTALGEVAAGLTVSRSRAGDTPVGSLEGGATAAEKALSELRERIEEDAAGVLPGRSPQVSDRYAIVVGVHVGTEVECLAELVELVLRLAWSRQSAAPWPEPLRGPLHGMGGVVGAMLAEAADLLESEDAEAEADLLARFHEVAQRQRLLYELLFSRAEPAAAGDIAEATLLACYYQRCAGHAVSIARHAALFATTAQGLGRTDRTL